MLEREMLKQPKEHHLKVAPVHHLADGIYAREITVPAGSLITGLVHKAEHLNIISKGDITVWTEDGMRRIQAPFTMVSRPGTKRVGFTHAETVWTTIHANPTNESDIHALEAALVEPMKQYNLEDATCHSLQ